MSNVFIISAPSGAGKTSIIKRVVAETNISLSVSYTTRSPRENEIHGKDYFFVDDVEFNNMVSEDKFYEHAEVFGNNYGTARASIESVVLSGSDVILEIDWQGALLVREQLPESIWVFVVPPSLKELRCRLEQRQTNSTHDMDLRLSQAKSDLTYASKADYVLINDDFDRACAGLQSIIVAESMRSTRQRQVLCDILEGL